jgi:hypothetical protein
MPKQQSIFTRTVVLSLFCALLPLGLGACGGDSDDDDSEFVGAARVSVQNAPSKIDTGDRTRVRIGISAVNENGIALKILYPEGLAFVENSAVLELSEDETEELVPALNVEGDDGFYLLFFLSEDQFEERKRGVLELQLEGISSVRDGKIEIDADVNDPLIEDSEEFDLEDPQFVSESESSIEVIE